MSKPVWCIIGGGNGGHAAAGHLAILGFQVRLYDIFAETVEVLSKQGGIEVEGGVNGFGKLEFATTDLKKAVTGADIVMIIAPAIAHKKIATDCASMLVDGQTVVLHPGSTCGALEFYHVLNQQGCRADITVAETNSLLYACRLVKPGHVNIFGVKEKLMVAALPSNKTKKVTDMLNQAFPQIYAGKNVLECSFENLNAMMHPAPTILNTSLIESDRDWLYYYDGITPSIGAFVEEMDKDRLEIGKAYGLELTPLLEWYKSMYNAVAPTLSEAVKKNKAYAGVKGHASMNTRYLYEDIPMGLVPLAALGKLVGKQSKRIEAIIQLGEFLLHTNYSETGRNLKNLGLEGRSVAEIQKYLETGSF